MSDSKDKRDDTFKDKYEEAEHVRSGLPEAGQRCPDCKARPGDPHRKGCRYA